MSLAAESTDSASAVHDDVAERELATRVAAGDVSAFASLLSTYWLPLVTYAARRLPGMDAAEDIVQETFVRLWEGRAQLRTTTSPRAYLYRLTRNLVIDELRKQQVRNRWPTRFRRSDPPAPPTPAQLFDADALEEAAARAIEMLPERRREVFVLAHLQDLSYQQIASVLGITPRTVANHMSLALRELRCALQPFLDQRLGPP